MVKQLKPLSFTTPNREKEKFPSEGIRKWKAKVAREKEKREFCKKRVYDAMSKRYKMLTKKLELSSFANLKYVMVERKDDDMYVFDTLLATGKVQVKCFTGKQVIQDEDLFDVVKSVIQGELPNEFDSSLKIYLGKGNAECWVAFGDFASFYRERTDLNETLREKYLKNINYYKGQVVISVCLIATRKRFKEVFVVATDSCFKNVCNMAGAGSYFMRKLKDGGMRIVLCSDKKATGFYEKMGFSRKEKKELLKDRIRPVTMIDHNDNEELPIYAFGV